MRKFPTNGPTVRWRAVVGGGYSGPAVASGKVYLTDRQLAKDTKNPSDPFQAGIIPGSERVLCLDEATGGVLWTHSYDCPYSMSYPAGPRATPLISAGRVYTLGAEGNLFCLEANTGEVIWARDLRKDYHIPTPMWGFAGHPLLDGDRLICLVGGSNSVAVAFDKNSGAELWRALGAKEPGYCPPTMIEAGGQRQVIIWDPESVNSLDPKNGRVNWSLPCDIKAGMTIPTPRQLGDKLFLTCFYNGSMMLELDADKPGASVLWQSKRVSEKNTDALHSTMSTPFLEEASIYGVCSYGQLRCLKLDTGERLWETLRATTPDDKEMRWANAFLVRNGDRFFLFNEKGDLIIAKLSPQGYEEISRAHVLEPTNTAAGRDVLWSHPAFANRRMYARNDREIICVDLAEQP
jgi:outer membrane protein assembly factor BamB